MLAEALTFPVERGIEPLIDFDFGDGQALFVDLDFETVPLDPVETVEDEALAIDTGTELDPATELVTLEVADDLVDRPLLAADPELREDEALDPLLTTPVDFTVVLLVIGKVLELRTALDVEATELLDTEILVEVKLDDAFDVEPVVDVARLDFEDVVDSLEVDVASVE